MVVPTDGGYEKRMTEDGNVLKDERVAGTACAALMEGTREREGGPRVDGTDGKNRRVLRVARLPEKIGTGSTTVSVDDGSGRREVDARTASR
jgi:hypothetical protein